VQRQSKAVQRQLVCLFFHPIESRSFGQAAFPRCSPKKNSKNQREWLQQLVAIDPLNPLCRMTRWRKQFEFQISNVA
jgi:hypothetical protein